MIETTKNTTAATADVTFLGSQTQNRIRDPPWILGGSCFQLQLEINDHGFCPSKWPRWFLNWGYGVTNKLQTRMIFRVEALNSGSGIIVICPDILQHGNPRDKSSVRHEVMVRDTNHLFLCCKYGIFTYTCLSHRKRSKQKFKNNCRL